MKTVFRILGVCCAMLAGWGYSQPLPPPTTPYTRGFLRSLNQSNAWYVLGITGTNQAQVTNWITAIPAGTVTPAMLNAAVSNAYMWAGTNAARTVVGQSNLVTAAQVGTQIGSSNLLTAAQVGVQIASSNLLDTGSSLNGAKLSAGTVNSSALDAATAAQLGGSPQTNISYVAVTNAPWLLPNGDGSQLTGVIALGTNSVTATWTNNGSVDSNMVAHIYGNPRTWEIRRPTDGFCTYPSSTYTEAQVIQAASNMWVRGYVAAGMDLLELSDGWGNTNRTVGGALMYNTVNFPSGMPWVVEHCRTNYGVKIGFYMQGAHNVTNSVSVWGSIPTTDFQHLDMDVNTLVGEWGASHIRSDWFGFDQWDDVRAFLERLTYQADYAGKTNIYNQRPISVQWFTDLPVWWDAGEPSAVPPFMADYANVMRVGSDHSSRELVLSGLEFMKHYFHLIGPGHYIFTDTEMDSGTISGLTTGEIRRNIGLGSLMHSPLQFTWNGLATAVPTYMYKEEWFTNRLLRDIRWDAAANPPTIAYTNLLSGTNGGECWITPLQNGDYAVALWNRANTGGSLSNRITIEQAGLNTWDPQNGTYWTRSATSWTNANGYTLLNDPSGSDRGIYWWTTNSTYGMSYYYLYPALTNVNGSQWIGTNSSDPGNLFVNGGSMKVWYDQGRTMSFGTTNIAALGTSGWTYRDVWTGWYGTATNSLTWSVPTNDLAIFRVSAPAIWPAAGSGDMLAANNLSDVANAGTSRTNLAAHNASNLTTGTLATNLLPALLAANVTGTAARATADASGNTIASTYLTVASAYTTATNSWALNATVPWGTNALKLSSGATTGGIIGISGFPTSAKGKLELSIDCTGNITFTNISGIYTSDFVNSRTLTNGNLCEIEIVLIPGWKTNIFIVQSKAQ